MSAKRREAAEQHLIMSPDAHSRNGKAELTEDELGRVTGGVDPLRLLATVSAQQALSEAPTL